MPALAPLSFEPNRGQMEGGAQFIARGAGYHLELDGSGSKMVLRSGGKSAELRTVLLGSNTKVELRGDAALPGHSAYFRGNDRSRWITGIPTYRQVKASGVYPGIDVVYHGNQSQLEYDFVVHPGANPARIHLQFDGATGLRTDSEGNLIVATAAGDLVEHRPVMYQTIAGVRQSVAGSFRVTGRNQAGFTVGQYDADQTLTIDPVLVYSSFLGGLDTDEGHAIATDSSGNTYMVGITFSTKAGDSDVLLRKISPDGTTTIYIADLGGSDNDYGNGIGVDVNGFVTIGGRTRSTDFPVANAFQTQNYGVNNAFVARIDPAATTLIYSTYIGGSNDDRGYALTLDRQGSAYLTGIVTSDDFPASNGAFQRSRRGGTDAFVCKFALDGTAVYATLLGGQSDDTANGVAVDANGNAYVVGDTASDGFPQANAPFQHSRHGGLDGFVSEISADGTQLLFSTFIGGSGDDSCGGVAVDLAGNVYVVGSTTSDKDFNLPGKSYNTGFNGGASDIFVAKYTPNGQNLAWTTFLGSHGGDYGNAIATDANGNVYIAGDTDSDQYPVTDDATQGRRAANVDAVLSVLDTNGQNLLYSTFYGGRGDDSALGIAVDAFSQVYLTGSTDSSDLPIRQAVQAQPGGGSSDAFLAKISVYGSAIPGSTPSSDPAPLAVTGTSAATRASVFGRQMIAPAGQFDREAQTMRNGAIAPARNGAIAPESVRQFQPAKRRVINR